MKAVLLACVLTLGLSIVSVAQSASQPAKSSYQGQGSPTVAGGGAAEQQLATASKQAAGEQVKQQDENAQFKESPSIQWMSKKLHISTGAAYWISLLLNFAVIAALVLLGIKKFVPEMLRSRTESIRKQMEDAQRSSEDANRRLREIEAKLAQMGTEIAAFESQAAEQQRNEEAAFKTAIEEERQRILATAKQEIESASSNALRELRARAAELAISLAEKKIHVDAAADQVLVRDFVGQLGKDGQ